jgi:hypothetical protein
VVRGIGLNKEKIKEIKIKIKQKKIKKAKGMWGKFKLANKMNQEFTPAIPIPMKAKIIPHKPDLSVKVNPMTAIGEV